MQKRKTYHHGDLKAALVRAGIELLEAEGLPALSLRAIAARVGVSHTAPRNHFGSLRGLLTAIAAEGFRLHAAEMRAGIPDPAPPRERLRAAMEGYVRFAMAHPGLFELMFSPVLCDHGDPALSEAARASYAVLEDIARGLDWDKADQPGGQRRSEMMLWSLAHGYAKLALARQFREDGAGHPEFAIAEVMPDFGYR